MTCFIMFACHTVLLASIVIAVDASHRRREKKRGVKMNVVCPMCGKETMVGTGEVDCRLCWHRFRVKDDGTVSPPDDSPEAWRLECERLAFNAGALLRVARWSFSYSAILEIIREAPRSQEELTGPFQDTLFTRAMKDVARLNRADKLFDSVMDYFLNYLVKMDKERRATLEACVIGTLLGTGMS